MDFATVLSMLRVDLDDIVLDYLWSDEELAGYIDQGYKEFARVTHLLTDQSTAGVAVLAVTGGDPWLTLSPSVVDIRRAIFQEAGGPVIKLSLANFNQVPIEDQLGQPYCIVTDQENGKIRLVKTPPNDGTLTMNVVRMPLDDLSDLTQDPMPTLEFLDRRYWQIINVFAASLAWRNPDVDTNDIRRAQEAESRFYELAEQVHDEIQRRTRTAGQVAYGGFYDGAQTNSSY